MENAWLPVPVPVPQRSTLRPVPAVKTMPPALMGARLPFSEYRGEQKTSGNFARKEPFSDGKALRKNKRKKASILAFF
jgi:hypothetical protein